MVANGGEGKKQVLCRLLVFLEKERSVSQLGGGFACLPRAEEPSMTAWSSAAEFGEGRDQTQGKKKRSSE